MVPARLEEAAGAISGEATGGWKCLLCGEIIDSVIAANRKHRQEPLPTRPRPHYPISLAPAKSSGPKRKATPA
jgi:hypothetical protein